MARKKSNIKTNTRFYFHLKEKGSDLKKMAKTTGIPYGQLWDYAENNKNPGIKRLEVICDYLGISATDYLGF